MRREFVAAFLWGLVSWAGGTLRSPHSVALARPQSVEVRILINEVVTDPQQDWSDNDGGNGVPFDGVPGTGAVTVTDEWIELYNAGDGVVDLSGWSLEMVDTTPETLAFADPGSAVLRFSSGGSASNFQPGEYLVIGNPPGAINNDLFVVLRDPSGAVIDDVEIGNDPEGDGSGDGAPDGGTSDGNATGPDDEAVARFPNATDSDNDVNDFSKQAATIAASNGELPVGPFEIVINEIVTDPQQDWSDNAGGNGVPFDGVPGSGSITSTDEWVELFNAGDKSVNLVIGGGWSLEFIDSTPATLFFSDPGPAVLRFSSGGSLSNFQPGEYLVIGNPPGAINNDVYLVLRDATGAVIDDVEIGDDFEQDGPGDGAPNGGTSDGNATGLEDEAVARFPNGVDTNDDVADFAKRLASIGSSNGERPPPPVAAFSAHVVTGVTPLTVEFTDESTGEITSWLWDFGDGTTSTEQHPTHTYTVEVDPKFTVSLTVTGPGGSDTETKEEYITVLLPPVVDFAGSPVSGLAPLEVAFRSEVNAPVTSYEWDFGDGGGSSEANPTHTYEAAGTYTVTLTIDGPRGGGSRTKSAYITVVDCFTKLDLVLDSASEAYPGEGWDNAIDGDVDGWDGTVTAEGEPPWAIFGFADGRAHTVDRVRLLTDTGVRFGQRWVKHFRVLVSRTGTADSDFSEVLSASKTNGGWESYSFPATEAKYMKVVLDSPTSGWRQLGEVEVWEAADPNPPDAVLSTIEVTSPHVADGTDAAEVTIVLQDSTGSALTGKPSSAFRLFATGSNNVFGPVEETATPGTYRATLTSITAETKTVWAVVGCVRIEHTSAGEAAQVEFTPVPVRQADLQFVEGSPTYPGEGWENATDGDVEGWDGTVTTQGDTAYGIFSFAGLATERVAGVRLRTDSGVGFSWRWVRRFEVLVSTTGTAAEDFVSVLRGELVGGGWHHFTIAPTAAKYVKLVLEEPVSGWRQFAELEVDVVDADPLTRLAESGFESPSEDLSLVPKAYSLSPNYPNPFNPETVIRFRLPETVPVELVVYDVQGRLVRRLVEGTLPAGMHTVRWDGRDSGGRPVSSGVYVYRLRAGEFVARKRMVLLR